MREILLTKGQVALVDDEDFTLVGHLKWYAQSSASGFYAARRMVINGKSKIVLLHRYLLDVYDDRVVDHKNHNTLDCTRNNLRITTQSGNGANTRKSISSSSKYKGVSYSAQLHRINHWCAEITVRRVKIGLGHFATELEAAKVYDFNALQWFGEFALTNKILYPEDFKECSDVQG